MKSDFNKQKPNRINEEIKSFKVRLVGDNIKEPGVYFKQKAQEMADALNLDLVEVSFGQDISICKIMNYQKFLYDKKKNEKKPDKVETKELKFTPTIGDHDFEFKLRHAKNFLEKGNRVKALVFFKGREMKYREQGENVMNRLSEELREYGMIDAPLKMEGNKMIAFFKPKKK